MLILTRKTEEEIIIDNDIRIKILVTSDNQVKLGITAPGNVKILRAEVYEKIKKANIEASSSATGKIDLSKYKLNAINTINSEKK